MNDRALIKPLVYDDLVTGNKIEVSLSEYYSRLKINERKYYFIRETGAFDGTAMPMKGED